MSNVYEFRPGGQNAGLDPLGRYRAGHGIDSSMRAVFDVLYEAGEPLDIDTLAERTYERVDAPSHYHARRAYVRKLERDRRRQQDLRSGTYGPSEKPHVPDMRHAWRQHLQILLKQATRRGVLLRHDGPVFEPNPAKPPRVQQPDGRVRLYTREQALGLSALEQEIGDVSAMRSELNRLLTGLTEGELRQAVELAAVAFAPNPSERTDPRVLRSRLRWLLSRPTTDAGRAWLLGELVRRAYGQPPDRS
jgi:hypothetical protein